MKKIFYLLLILSNYAAAQSLNFTFDGQARTCNIHLPTNYNSTTKYPVVLVLHGLTQTGASIQSYSELDKIADTANFIAVYPDGLNTQWNATIGATGTNDVGYLNALLDSVFAKYSVNLARVYSCGFSNGGYMSHRLACEYTNRFAAIASVAGTMFDATFTACNPSRAIPVMQIHGTTDFVVSYIGNGTSGKGAADVINFWVNKNTCNTTAAVTTLPNIVTTDNSTVIQNLWTGCNNNTTCKLLKIQGGGHQWPSPASLSGIGTINLDIHGGREIWQFFSQHMAPLSVNNIVKKEITLLPNPTKNYITIVGANINKAIIISAIGVVQNVRLSNNVIDVQHLASGIYTLKLNAADGSVYYKQIVKQ